MLYEKIPPLMISVIGYKKSGKTTVAESIISILQQYNLKIAAVKHIHEEAFSIDPKNHDSGRFSSAGAQTIVIIAPHEFVLINKKSITYNSIIKELNGYAYDAIVLEGFKNETLIDPSIYKILCVRNLEELREFRKSIKGKIMMVCSLKTIDDKITIIGQNNRLLKSLLRKVVDQRIKIQSIVTQLPGLDCKKCGYSSCYLLAEAIFKGNVNYQTCTVLKTSTSQNIELVINHSIIPLQPFVAKIMRSTLLGLILNLKGVSIKGNEKITLQIDKAS